MEEKERFSIGIINGILYLYDNFNKSNTEITLKDLSDLLNQQDKRIKELEELLKTAREFETPRIARYAVVKYICWKNEPYKIVYGEDAYKDKNGKIVQVWYSGQSHNFKLIKICDTEEEAKSLIKQLRENRCNG